MSTDSGVEDRAGRLIGEGILNVPPDIAERIMGGDRRALIDALRQHFGADADEDDEDKEEKVRRREIDKRVSQNMIDVCNRHADTLIAAERAIQDIRKTFGEAVGYKGAAPAIFDVLEKIDSAEATMHSLRKMARTSSGLMERAGFSHPSGDEDAGGDMQANDDIAL